MWQRHQTLVYYVPEVEETPLAIAGFDLDSTLTQSKSGRKFVLDETDWIFTYDSVPSTLLDLQEKGYLVAIFTNQSKYSSTIQGRIESVREHLLKFGVNVAILIATKDDEWRKPSCGMFEGLASLLGVEDLDEFRSKSVYVGDAVGPTSTWPPYQWADTDAEFARACQLTFYTPMEIFPEQPAPSPSTDQELILTVGNQGSGKTTFSTQFATDNPQYVVVSQDVVGKKPDVLAATVRLLQSGKSVIVDRTNPSPSDRLEFINLAGQTPVRVWWFARDGRPFNALRPKPVPDIAYNIYSKLFSEPCTSEGLASVHRLN